MCPAKPDDFEIIRLRRIPNLLASLSTLTILNS